MGYHFLVIEELLYQGITFSLSLLNELPLSLSISLSLSFLGNRGTTLPGYHSLSLSLSLSHFLLIEELFYQGNNTTHLISIELLKELTLYLSHTHALSLTNSLSLVSYIYVYIYIHTYIHIYIYIYVDS